MVKLTKKMHEVLKNADLARGEINNVPMRTLYGLEVRKLVTSEWRKGASRVITTTTGGTFPMYSQVKLTDSGLHEVRSVQGLRAVRTHYLDTSSIIKLFLNEPKCEIIREYFNKQTTFYTTSLCFAETLGKLKDMRFNRKPPNRISEVQYLNVCNELMAHITSGAIGIDEIAINNREVFKEVENIVQKHSLDVSDAFQIYTLKKGYFSRLRGESSPLLITADGELAIAARKEGLKAWNCVKESTP